VVISKFKSGPESTGVKQACCFKVNRLVMLINLVYLVKAGLYDQLSAESSAIVDGTIVVG
jgi:hypothetical protein